MGGQSTERGAATLSALIRSQPCRSFFWLLHGLGLTTKIQGFDLSPDGLSANLLAFNAGVELGQIAALSVIRVMMGWWRRSTSFWRHAYSANVAIMSAGFVLVLTQFAGYFVIG
ncbi:HupE/UreJ family protein [Acuticoccus kandeliae]|uniref:HupE/UreJ family protein n=1 Tax=Acuticoccus kandeliae TaxID=2073160 RepID=UPI000D3E6FB7